MISKVRFFKLLLVILFFTVGCASEPPAAQGHLFIIGGGKRPAALMKKFVELAGGPRARVAIIPMASEFAREAGRDYEQEFRHLGVKEARAFWIPDRAAADSDSLAAKIQEYSAVFFGGGDQNRLTRIFLGSRLLEGFKRMYQNGAVIGGTSAGAAVMSRIMITGDGNWETIRKDSVATAPGFGFVENAVIDQHFIRRQRLNRLLAVVLQNRVMGIGIDESTAIWIKPGGEVEVLGESTVLLLDPWDATIPTPGFDPLLTARDMRLSLLRAGEIFRIP